MESFLSDYWPYIIASLPIVAKILNSITPRWPEVSGVIYKVLLLAVEALDVVRRPSAYKKSFKK